LAYIAVAAILVAGAFAIAYIHGSAALSKAQDATMRAQHTADCVNDILAIRQHTSAADAAAYLAFVTAVNSLFLPPTATERDRLASVANFKAVSLRVQIILATDQKIRAAHPLGRC
jgi:hypothetical protein